MTEKRVPRLRFRDENGQEFPEWNKNKLGEIAKFSKGKGISKDDITSDGQTPCIRYGELYTHYTEVIDNVNSCTNIDNKDLVFSCENDLIIPSSGETHIDIATASCVMNSGVALGGDLNIIKTEHNGVFLAYYLNNTKKNDIARLAQGSSVIHLYEEGLRRLSLRLPNLKEQQKIADFLSSVDEKITLLQKQKTAWETYKKGIMQQIFSQKIRFKDDKGQAFLEWKEYRFREITTYFSKRNKHLINAKVYSVTNSHGFILQEEHFERTIASVDLSSYKIIEKGDFAYNPARINVGSIAFFKADIGLISSLYVCFKTNNLVLPEFFSYILELRKTKFQIENLGEGGVRIYLWYELFALIKSKLPCIKEQQKIADFLSSLDNKITALDKQISAAQQWKKGLMQQMFV